MTQPAVRAGPGDPQPDLSREAIQDKLGDWEWRMNNLYRVINRDGREVTFRMNPAQRRLFENLWYRNCVLKARQLGFTTFMLVFMLDAAIFRPNVRCGLIAHKKEDAQRLFREKLLFAYNKLPAWQRKLCPAKNESAGELVFHNNSSITVSTSYRGGTLNYLHVSEFGKICQRYPDKAEEIVTGAFEAVGKNGVITVESTAEGRQGYFFDICQNAELAQKQDLSLTRLDFRFFFYPWHYDPANRIPVEEAADVRVPQRLIDYFVDLRKKHNITLDKAQMIWYVLKERSLGTKMKREHPSTPDEAFWESVEGAYYREQIDAIYLEKRLCRVPHHVGVHVHTFWDLGINDANAIWFIQRIGREWHVIDYYENSDVGVTHYAKVLHEKAQERGFLYGLHVGPHDLEQREWGVDGRTRKESAKAAGINFHVAPNIPRADGIEAVRTVLPTCVFDEEHCAEGFANLAAYRKEWDDKRGMWKDTPFHGPESNGADAFRYFAVSIAILNDYLQDMGSVKKLQQAAGPGGYYA